MRKTALTPDESWWCRGLDPVPGWLHDVNVVAGDAAWFSVARRHLDAVDGLHFLALCLNAAGFRAQQWK